MNNDRKRDLATRDDIASKNKAPPKKLKATQRDTEPFTPPQALPIVVPVAVPDTASFLRQINSTVHPASTYSTAISDQFQKLRQPWDPKSDANLTKPGHLSTKDYEDGYISDEGDKLLKAIHARKDEQIAKVQDLPDGRKSRSGNQIKLGDPTSVQYHGVDIRYRVDFTGIAEKPPKATGGRKKKKDEAVEEVVEPPIEPPKTTWIPHARIFAGDQDLSTVKLASLAEDIHGQVDDSFKQHFLSGVKGQASPTPEKSSAYAIGVESRAVARASDAFGQQFPSFEGYLLSKPQSAHEVTNLFHNPQFGTGALGSQNSGPTATPDFHAFNEIVSDARKEHSTQVGTHLQDVPLIRKANAINVFAPHDSPIVTVNTGRKKDD